MSKESLQAIRRKRLFDAAHERFAPKGLQRKLADLLECSPTYISRVLCPPDKSWHKKIGEDMARHIEHKLDKPVYWLDGHEAADRQWPLKHITRERLAALDANQRGHLEKIIETILPILESQSNADRTPRSTDEA